MENSLVTQDSTHRGFCSTFSLYMYVWIDLHALIMNNFKHRVLCMDNFEHRVLRIERITVVQRCASRSTEFASQDAAHKGFCWTFLLYRPSRFLEQFRTQGFLRVESTAVQRCARKSTELASG